MGLRRSQRVDQSFGFFGGGNDGFLFSEMSSDAEFDYDGIVVTVSSSGLGDFTVNASF